MSSTATYNLILVGASGVGKSSLLLRFIDNTFSDDAVSVSPTESKSREFEVDGSSVRVQVSEAAASSPVSDYSSYNGILLIYDVTSTSSFEACQQLHADITTANKSTSTPQILLVGHKCDQLTARTVSYEQAKDWCDSQQVSIVSYIETSAKVLDENEEAINVEKAFRMIVSEIRAVKEGNESTTAAKKSSPSTTASSKDISRQSSVASSINGGGYAAALEPHSDEAVAAAAAAMDDELAKTQQLESTQQQQQPNFHASSAASFNSTTSSTASTHPQLQALRKIDLLSDKLQHEGKLLESLQCMEKSLILRGHIFGLDSIEVFKACKLLSEMCNYLGMSFLQQGMYDITLELLKKAEVLSERHRTVRAVTYNNLSCYYRKQGKLRTALQYVRKALAIETKILNESQNQQQQQQYQQDHTASSASLHSTASFTSTGPLSSELSSIKFADTHLNMCTILSELKRHEKAIIHAKIGLKLLLRELFGELEQQTRKMAEAQQQDGRSEEEKEQPYNDDAQHHESIAIGGATLSTTSLSSLRAKLPPDRVAILAIAYHNLAVQQEFLHQYNDSLISYEKATKVITTHLGAQHPLVASLTESYHEAQKKMKLKLAKQKDHQQARQKALQHSNKIPKSRLEQHAMKSAKNLHALVQSMPDQPFSDGEYAGDAAGSGGEDN